MLARCLLTLPAVLARTPKGATLRCAYRLVSSRWSIASQYFPLLVVLRGCFVAVHTAAAGAGVAV
jgi:hypothetical protein|eukprot:COSAG01_NODE_5283_length_4357_cov_369.903711_5_plen_65_part_00